MTDARSTFADIPRACSHHVTALMLLDRDRHGAVLRGLFVLVLSLLSAQLKFGGAYRTIGYLGAIHGQQQWLFVDSIRCGGSSATVYLAKSRLPLSRGADERG